jgi:hypothetical protein
MLTTYYAEFYLITVYLTCGVVLNLFYDLLISWIKNEALRFGNWERLGVTIIWPIFLIIFIINFIKALFGNDKQ